MNRIREAREKKRPHTIGSRNTMTNSTDNKKTGHLCPVLCHLYFCMRSATSLSRRFFHAFAIAGAEDGSSSI